MMKNKIWTLALGPLTLGLASCSGNSDGGGLPDLLQTRTGGEAIYGLPQEDCAECHPQHVQEWSISNHAYAAKDPVFHAMTRLGQEQSNGKLGQFCIQCHSPIGLAQNLAPVTFDEAEGKFVQDTENLGALGQTGVSCDVCHTITNVLQPVNARVVYTPDGVRRATIKDPVETPAHASEYSPLHEESEVCGPCHAVTNPKGAKLEETFNEWEASSFAQPGGQTCQDCHMPAYTGKATDDGPERTLHRHTFVGVDVSLLPPEEFPGYDEMRDLTSTLLKESAIMTAQADAANKQINVNIQNLAGHALPSGATAERQMWLEVIVRDAQGQVVFESGTLDENGDLRDENPEHTTQPNSDPQLVYYGQQMTVDPTVADPNSTGAIKPVTFPWQANERINRLIAADATDTKTFDLSTVGTGDYTASIRLLFRTFPMYFLVKLEEKAGLDPAVRSRVPTVEMQATELTFSF